MNIKLTIPATVFLAALSTAAFAQAPPTTTTPPPATAPTNAERGSANCTPTQAVPQDGTIVPRGNSTTGQTSEPLGDKLARSDGVLCPPTDVDPDMHAPTPKTGTMKVIPPPGSPGGDPNVRPK